MTYSELKTMLASHNIQLFDVRNPDEYQAGQIPQAINVPRKQGSETCRDLSVFLHL